MTSNNLKKRNNQKIQTLHFIIDGKFLQDHSRTLYWYEDREENAKRLLKDGLIGITDEQVMKIINGEAILKGSSICEQKDCEQCKGLEQITYTETEDIKFKNEIRQRELWINEVCYKIGEFHIQKHLIIDYLDLYAKYAIKQERRDDVEWMDEYLQSSRDSLWKSTSHRLPSIDYIPEKGTVDYDFTITINEFVKKSESRLSIAGINADVIADEIKNEIRIIKEDLESRFVPKPIRAEGNTLITVPDPENNFEFKTFNIPKEQLLNYLRSRSRGERALKFTLNLDIDKEQVLKRYENIQKQMGNIHDNLMKSMNLKHSNSGIYSNDNVEYYVNEAVQYFVLEHSFSLDTDELKKLPDEIKLVLPENHGYVDVYVDGKLVEEKRDLR